MQFFVEVNRGRAIEPAANCILRDLRDFGNIGEVDSLIAGF
jgi:hypothetical protein